MIHRVTEVQVEHVQIEIGDIDHQVHVLGEEEAPSLQNPGCLAELPTQKDGSITQKIKDLDARIDAINTGTNVLVTVDTLIKQTKPLFTERGSARSWFRKLPPGTIDSFGDLSRLFVANFLSCRGMQKNASHLFTIHQKEIESLKDYVRRFNQVVLKVKDPNNKVVIMAMIEGLRPDSLFDSLSKNVLETLSTLQSKVDKYIVAKELTKAKQRRRGRDDYKRKEPEVRRSNYKDKLKEQIANLNKRGYLRKYVADRLQHDSLERRYGDNRPTVGDIQGIHSGFGLGGAQARLEKDTLEMLVGKLGKRGNATQSLEWIKLQVTLGTKPHQTTVWQDFIVVDLLSPYNAILGHPTLGGIKAITSTYHMMMKFPTLTVIGEVRGDQKVVRQCFISATRAEPSSKTSTQ
ncbi:hypothetical protein Acr_10g0010120 [Actinidia rufa]|uniref:Retrotransposon gag domain-containing protein n=1 Tax=Actinidia rufa TaxID=165716 RepID=A0A7J0FCK6_9ERIC|nr:hypothetical protein Acr_10g0010120 [Actinidia rufa]